MESSDYPTLLVFQSPNIKTGIFSSLILYLFFSSISKNLIVSSVYECLNPLGNVRNSKNHGLIIKCYFQSNAKIVSNFNNLNSLIMFFLIRITKPPEHLPLLQNLTPQNKYVLGWSSYIRLSRICLTF